MGGFLDDCHKSRALIDKGYKGDSLQEKLEMSEKENSRLRKYIQGQHEATLQTIDAYQKQIEVLTCKKQ
jgi:hypothetical protein